MEFPHTKAQSAFRADVREFVEAAVRPVAAELDRTETYPASLLDEMAERGWTGLTIAEKYGGAGTTVVELAICIEELSRVMMPLASTVALHLGVAAEIESLGSESICNQYLPAMARFETVAALGLTEATAGTDTYAMRTTAERDGSEWVLSGEKQWVTNYRNADVLLIYAKTGPPTDEPANISAFLVPAASVTKETVWETIGARSVKSVAVSFDGIRVPTAQQIGPVGAAYSKRGAAGIGINLPARAVGIAAGALAETIETAGFDPQRSTRESSAQATRHAIADLVTQLRTARLQTLQAAQRIAEGTARPAELAMVKVQVTETCLEITEACLEVQGWAGVTNNRDIERFVRDARLLLIAGGPNDNHRNSIADTVIEQADQATQPDTT